MTEQHVVILGGGITGLAAAYRLRQFRDAHSPTLRCSLFEQDDRLGGKIQTKRTHEYTLELGPDSIFTRKPWGLELIEELGLSSEIVPVTSGGGTFIWHNEHLHPLPPGFNAGVPSDLSAFAKTGLLSLQGKRRGLDDLLLPYQPYSNDMPLGVFLRERLGDEIVDTIATPLLAGIHAGDIDRMSLDATMPALRRFYEEHESLILGAMAAHKNNPSAQGGAPAGPVFINLRNGMEQLIDTLVEELRGFADVQLNATVTKVTRMSSGKYEVTWSRAGALQIVEADAVIMATPADVTAALLSESGFNTGLLSSIRYASTATISFGYKTNPGVDFPGSGYLVPRSSGSLITACTVVSTKWRHASKTGNTLIRCYVGYDGSEEMVDWDDARLTQAMLDHLKQTLGTNASPEFVEIKRWHHSMPQYDVGHLVRMNEIDAELQSLPGVSLAGAAYHGVGIPDCIRDATRASEQVTTYLTNRNR